MPGRPDGCGIAADVGLPGVGQFLHLLERVGRGSPRKGLGVGVAQYEVDQQCGQSRHGTRERGSRRAPGQLAGADDHSTANVAGRNQLPVRKTGPRQIAAGTVANAAAMELGRRGGARRSPCAAPCGDRARSRVGDGHARSSSRAGQLAASCAAGLRRPQPPAMPDARSRSTAPS